MSDHLSTRSRPRIVVAGATGRVGAALVTSLAGHRVDVVTLSRNASAADLPASTQVVGVDFNLPASLAEPMRGADRLFLAHGTPERQVENEVALIDAAVAAGVKHIVKLSAMGPPTHLHPFDWHTKIEAHLAGQDVGYTVLRPSCFVDVLTRAKGPVSHGSWAGTAGDGRVNLVDTRDIAEVAQIPLLDDRFPGSQRAYHLTGRGSVSMPEIAEELSRILSRTVTYRHRTRAEHRAILIASGASELLAELLLGLDQIFREEVLAETTGTIEELTGNQPRSAAEWLRHNAPAFRLPLGAANA